MGQSIIVFTHILLLVWISNIYTDSIDISKSKVSIGTK